MPYLSDSTREMLKNRITEIEAALEEVEADISAAKKEENPNLEVIALPVKQLLKNKCGFFFFNCSKHDADAIMRGEKTATVVNASCHIQKNDLFVFVPDLGPTTPSSFHDLSKVVFVATYISAIQNSNAEQIMVCFRQKTGFTFHHGYVGGEYIDDTITCKKLCNSHKHLKDTITQ